MGVAALLLIGCCRLPWAFGVVGFIPIYADTNTVPVVGATITDYITLGPWIPNKPALQEEIDVKEHF